MTDTTRMTYSQIPSPPAECELCDESEPTIYCVGCEQFFCSSCSEDYHKQAYRREHQRLNLKEEKEKEMAAKNKPTPAPATSGEGEPTVNPPTDTAAASSSSPAAATASTTEKPKSKVEKDAFASDSETEKEGEKAPSKSTDSKPTNSEERKETSKDVEPAKPSTPAASATTAPAPTKKKDDSSDEEIEIEESYDDEEFEVDRSDDEKPTPKPTAAKSEPVKSNDAPNSRLDDEEKPAPPVKSIPAAPVSVEDDPFATPRDQPAPGEKVERAKSPVPSSPESAVSRDSPPPSRPTKSEMSRQSSKPTSNLEKGNKKTNHNSSDPKEGEPSVAVDPKEAKESKPTKSKTVKVDEQSVEISDDEDAVSQASVSKGERDSKLKESTGEGVTTRDEAKQSEQVKGPAEAKTDDINDAAPAPVAYAPKKPAVVRSAGAPGRPTRRATAEEKKPETEGEESKNDEAEEKTDEPGSDDNTDDLEDDGKPRTIKFSMDHDYSSPPGGKLPMFQKLLSADLSKSLNLPSTQVKVLSLTSGSIIAEFKIQPPQAEKSTKEFIKQSNDTESALFKGKVTSKTIPGSARIISDSVPSGDSTPRDESTSSKQASKPSTPEIKPATAPAPASASASSSDDPFAATPRNQAPGEGEESEPPSKSTAASSKPTSKENSPLSKPIATPAAPSAVDDDDDPFGSDAPTSSDPNPVPASKQASSNPPSALSTPRESSQPNSARSDAGAPSPVPTAAAAATNDDEDDPFGDGPSSIPPAKVNKEDDSNQTSDPPAPTPRNDSPLNSARSDADETPAPVPAAASNDNDDDPFGDSSPAVAPASPATSKPAKAQSRSPSKTEDAEPASSSSPAAQNDDPFATPRDEPSSPAPAALPSSRPPTQPSSARSDFGSSDPAPTASAPAASDDPFASAPGTPKEAPLLSDRKDESPRPAAEEIPPADEQPVEEEDPLATPKVDVTAQNKSASQEEVDPFATPRDEAPVKEPSTAAAAAADPFATPRSSRSDVDAFATPRSSHDADPFGSAASTPRHLDDDEPLFDESLDAHGGVDLGASIDPATIPEIKVPVLDIKDFMPKRAAQPLPNRTPDDKCSMCQEDACEVFCTDCNLALCQTRGCDKELHAGELSFHSRVPYADIVDSLPVPDDLFGVQQGDKGVSSAPKPAAPKLPKFDEDTKCNACSEAAVMYCLDCKVFLCGGACDAELHQRPSTSRRGDSARPFQVHHRRTLRGNIRVEDAPTARSSTVGSARQEWSTSPTCEVCRTEDAQQACGACAMNFCRKCDKSWHEEEELFREHRREKYTPNKRERLEFAKRTRSTDEDEASSWSAQDSDSDDDEINQMLKKHAAAPRSSPPKPATDEPTKRKRVPEPVEQEEEEKPDMTVAPVPVKPRGDPLLAKDALCSKCEDTADVWCEDCQAYFCAHPANEILEKKKKNQPRSSPPPPADEDDSSSTVTARSSSVDPADPLGLLDPTHHNNCDAHFHALAKNRKHIRKDLPSHAQAKSEVLEYMNEQRTLSKEKLDQRMAARSAARAKELEEKERKKRERQEKKARRRAEMEAVQKDSLADRTHAQLTSRSDSEHAALLSKARAAIRETEAARAKEEERLRRRQEELEASYTQAEKLAAARRRAERETVLEKHRSEKDAIEAEWRQRIEKERGKILAEIEAAKRTKEYKLALESARLDRLSQKAKHLGMREQMAAILAEKDAKKKKEQSKLLQEHEKQSAELALKRRREEKERERESILEGLVKAREERREARLAEEEKRERHEAAQAAEQKKVQERVRKEKAAAAEKAALKGPSDKFLPGGSKSSSEAQDRIAKMVASRAKREEVRLTKKKLTPEDKAKVEGKKAKERMEKTVISEEDSDEADTARENKGKKEDKSSDKPKQEKRKSKPERSPFSSSEDESSEEEVEEEKSDKSSGSDSDSDAFASKKPTPKPAAPASSSKVKDPFASSSEDEATPVKAPPPKKSTNTVRSSGAPKEKAKEPEPQKEEAEESPEEPESKSKPVAKRPAGPPPVQHAKGWGAGKKVNLLGRQLPKTILTEKEKEEQRIQEEKDKAKKEAAAAARKEKLKGLTGDGSNTLAKKMEKAKEPSKAKADDATPAPVAYAAKKPASVRSSGASSGPAKKPPTKEEESKTDNAEEKEDEPTSNDGETEDDGKPRTIKFSMDHDYSSPPGGKLPMFQKLLAADLSKSLNLPSTQVKVLSLTSGSIIAEFKIQPPQAEKSAKEFIKQSNDTDSQLFKGKVTSKTIPGSANITDPPTESSPSSSLVAPAKSSSKPKIEKDAFASSDSDEDEEDEKNEKPAASASAFDDSDKEDDGAKEKSDDEGEKSDADEQEEKRSPREEIEESLDLGSKSDDEEENAPPSKSIDGLDDSILKSDKDDDNEKPGPSKSILDDSTTSVDDDPFASSSDKIKPNMKKPASLSISASSSGSIDPSLLLSSPPPSVVIKHGVSPLPSKATSSIGMEDKKAKTIRGLLGETIKPSLQAMKEAEEASAIEPEEEEESASEIPEEDNDDAASQASESDPFGAERGSKFGATMRMPLNKTFKDFVLPTPKNEDDDNGGFKPASATGKFTAKFAQPSPTEGEEDEVVPEDLDESHEDEKPAPKSSKSASKSKASPVPKITASKWGKVKATGKEMHPEEESKQLHKGREEEEKEPSTKATRSTKAPIAMDLASHRSDHSGHSSQRSATASQTSPSGKKKKFVVPAEALGHSRVKKAAPIRDEEFPEDEAAKLWPTLHNMAQPVPVQKWSKHQGSGKIETPAPLSASIAKAGTKPVSSARPSSAVPGGRPTSARIHSASKGHLSKTGHDLGEILSPDDPDHPDHYHDEVWSTMKDVAAFKSATLKPYTIKGKEVQLSFHKKLEQDILAEQEALQAKLRPQSGLQKMKKLTMLAAASGGRPSTAGPSSGGTKSMANIALSAMLRGGKPSPPAASVESSQAVDDSDAGHSSAPNSARSGSASQRSSSTSRSVASVRSSSSTRSRASLGSVVSQVSSASAKKKAWSEDASSAAPIDPSLPLDETHPAVIAAAQKLVQKVLVEAASEPKDSSKQPVWGARQPPQTPKALAAAAAKLLERVANPTASGSRPGTARSVTLNAPPSPTPSAPRNFAPGLAPFPDSALPSARASARSVKSGASDATDIAEVLATRSTIPGNTTEEIPLVTLPPRKGVQQPGAAAKVSAGGPVKAIPSSVTGSVRVTPTQSPLMTGTPQKASTPSYNPLSRYPPPEPVSLSTNTPATASSASIPSAAEPPAPDVKSMMAVIEMEVAALRAAAKAFEQRRLTPQAALTYVPSGGTAPLPLPTNMALDAAVPSSQYHPDVPPIVFPKPATAARKKLVAAAKAATGVHNPHQPLETQTPVLAKPIPGTLGGLPGASPNPASVARLDPDAAYKAQLRRREITNKM